MVLSQKDIEERKRKAKKLVESIKKLNRLGLQFLLRSNNTFGGVVYHIERVPSRDLPVGYRTVLHLILPDGREAKEYADWYNAGNFEDCIVLSFPDSPFLLTMRRAPTMTDDEEDLEWILLDARAKSLAELKADVVIKQETIEELRWVIEEKDKTINSLKREVRSLRERVREYEAELDRISKEYVDLMTEHRQLLILVQKHMAGEIEATTAIKEILARAEAAGKYEVMGVKDRLIDVLKKEREISELLQIMYGGNGHINMDVLEKRLSKLVEEKLKAMIPEIVKSISASVKKEEIKEEATV